MQAKAEEEVIPQEDFSMEEEQEGAQQFNTLPPEMFQQQKPYSELTEEEKKQRKA